MDINRLKLSTPKEIRSSLSKIAREMLKGEISTEQAKAFTTISNAILSSIRLDEQEQLLQQLQDQLEELKNETK